MTVILIVMKITKHGHACLDIEMDGKRLVMDPGIFTEPLENYKNITAVVITDAHGDHLDLEKIRAVQLESPGAICFAIAPAAEAIGDIMPVQIVSHGSKATAKPFTLEFFGTDHLRIHESIPLSQNSGVLINEILYYPGDSLTLPHVPVQMLAVPSSGPWLKTGEAMDFIQAIKPKGLFPTHDGLYSETGRKITESYLKQAAERVGAQYYDLLSGSSLSV